MDKSNISKSTSQKQSKFSTNSLHIKPKIFFQEIWRCYNKLDMIHTTKQHAKMLHKASISPIITNKFDHDKTQRLCQTLKHTKYIEKLHLKLSKCSQSALELIALHLKSLNRLRDLSLDFSGCNKIHLKGLIAVFSSLKKSICLRDLHLDFNESALSIKFISQLTSLALRNQRNLRNLEISVQMLSNVTFTEMMNFVKSLKRCRNTLEILSLDFSGGQNLSTQILHCLLLDLEFFKSLTHFNLNLTKCQVLHPLPVEKGLVHYPVNQKFKSLRLNLEYYSCSNLYDFEILIVQLKDYKALEALDITFPEKADKILRIVSSNIKSMKSLKSLKVNFKSLYESPNINEFMPEFASALSCLQNLETLDLRFSGLNIKSRIVNMILEGIRTFQDLRSLTLSWRHNPEVNDKNAESLEMCLRDLTELVHLNIGLIGCNLTKTGITAIFKGLEGLKKLKSVEFEPGYPLPQSGSWLKNLFKMNRDIMPATGLGASFNEISNLTLNFFGLQLSEKELHNIALNLGKMKAISQLSLSFDFMNSDARWRTGFSSIMTVLNEIPRLHSLSIGLDNFGNEDLESLFIDLEGMVRLRSLSILLHKGEMVERHAAMRFWEAMRSLWRLKEFKMRLFWQNSFKAEAVRYLLLGLWEMECLESLVFDLLLSIDYLAVQGYGEVEAVEKKVLRKLKSLKTLRFLRYMDETIIY